MEALASERPGKGRVAARLARKAGWGAHPQRRRPGFSEGEESADVYPRRAVSPTQPWSPQPPARCADAAVQTDVIAIAVAAWPSGLGPADAAAEPAGTPPPWQISHWSESPLSEVSQDTFGSPEPFEFPEPHAPGGPLPLPVGGARLGLPGAQEEGLVVTIPAGAEAAVARRRECGAPPLPAPQLHEFHSALRAMVARWPSVSGLTHAERFISHTTLAWIDGFHPNEEMRLNLMRSALRYIARGEDNHVRTGSDPDDAACDAVLERILGRSLAANGASRRAPSPGAGSAKRRTRAPMGPVAVCGCTRLGRDGGPSLACCARPWPSSVAWERPTPPAAAARPARCRWAGRDGLGVSPLMDAASGNPAVRRRRGGLGNSSPPRRQCPVGPRLTRRFGGFPAAAQAPASLAPCWLTMRFGELPAAAAVASPAGRWRAARGRGLPAPGAASALPARTDGVPRGLMTPRWSGATGGARLGCPARAGRRGASPTACWPPGLARRPSRALRLTPASAPCASLRAASRWLTAPTARPAQATCLPSVKAPGRRPGRGCSACWTSAVLARSPSRAPRAPRATPMKGKPRETSARSLRSLGASTSKRASPTGRWAPASPSASAQWEGKHALLAPRPSSAADGGTAAPGARWRTAALRAAATASAPMSAGRRRTPTRRRGASRRRGA